MTRAWRIVRSQWRWLLLLAIPRDPKAQRQSLTCLHLHWGPCTWRRWSGTRWGYRRWGWYCQCLFCGYLKPC